MRCWLQRESFVHLLWGRCIHCKPFGGRCNLFEYVKNCQLNCVFGVISKGFPSSWDMTQRIEELIIYDLQSVLSQNRGSSAARLEDSWCKHVRICCVGLSLRCIGHGSEMLHWISAKTSLNETPEGTKEPAHNHLPIVLAQSRGSSAARPEDLWCEHVMTSFLGHLRNRPRTEEKQGDAIIDIWSMCFQMVHQVVLTSLFAISCKSF